MHVVPITVSLLGGQETGIPSMDRGFRVLWSPVTYSNEGGVSPTCPGLCPPPPKTPAALARVSPTSGPLDPTFYESAPTLDVSGSILSVHVVDRARGVHRPPATCCLVDSPRRLRRRDIPHSSRTGRQPLQAGPGLPNGPAASPHHQPDSTRLPAECRAEPQPRRRPERVTMGTNARFRSIHEAAKVIERVGGGVRT